MPIKSCLDRAMMKYGGSYLDTDVEEVKTITKIVLIFATLIPYWTIYFQVQYCFLMLLLSGAMKISLFEIKFEIWEWCLFTVGVMLTLSLL